MPRSAPKRLTFSLLTPPTGDVSHFSVTAFRPRDRGGTVSSVGPREAGDGPGLIVAYESLPGNLPHSYENTVALWPSLVPNLSHRPLDVVLVATDDQSGEVFIDYDLAATQYSVTYQVGESVHTMCALAQIQLHQPVASVAVPTYVSIAIDAITNQDIRVFYNTLPGNEPKTYDNWIGLWPGFALPYDGVEPQARATIPTDYSQGFLSLSYTPAALDYTLVYFTGPHPTNAAAWLYFEVRSEQ